MTRLKATSPAARIGGGVATALVIGIVAALASGDGGAAEPGAPKAATAPTDRAAIEAIVRDYILSHPEIIPEAINRMQNSDVAKLIDGNRQAIETPFAGAWEGNAKGDVTLVAFFDYACPYCRAGNADVQTVLKADPKLRIVYRDFPVLSPASEEAAMASLSAAQQGRYTAFHDRMFESTSRVSREKTVATVRAAGLDEARTARDLTAPTLRAEIKKNLDLGRAIGLTGTPSYVIGDRILSGAVGVAELKAAVAQARGATTAATGG